MRHVPGLLLIAIMMCSCHRQNKHEGAGVEAASPVIGITIFSSEYGGFGYDIRVDGKLLVHQPNIPAVAGYKGFPTEQSAQRVAALVAEKIRQNQMPPTLSTEDISTAMSN